MAKSENADPKKESEILLDSSLENKPRDSLGKNNPVKEKSNVINLYRFLQLKPQKKGIEALLVSKFKGQTKTLENWEITLKDLLATKTK